MCFGMKCVFSTPIIADSIRNYTDEKRICSNTPKYNAFEKMPL